MNQPTAEEVRARIVSLEQEIESWQACLRAIVERQLEDDGKLYVREG